MQQPSFQFRVKHNHKCFNSRSFLRPVRAAASHRQSAPTAAAAAATPNVASAAATPAAADAATAAPLTLLYDGIALDMDGTLTSCVIDFQDMRKRTGIPVGDLFVAMESWEEPDDIRASMDVILEIEAEASRNISGKEGLLELLQLLADSKVGVGTKWHNRSPPCCGGGVSLSHHHGSSVAHDTVCLGAASPVYCRAAVSSIEQQHQPHTVPVILVLAVS